MSFNANEQSLNNTTRVKSVPLPRDIAKRLKAAF
jgi:hypothetical protein